ncbi:hypothetical protein P4679_24060 [Priestia megaterium]|uniref:hypothetical protein n=1 Tax=Priestia megaterium TaxID=1404 RepID=UPI002E251131|nr:hypothetical protein [Priestia megaterium]
MHTSVDEQCTKPKVSIEEITAGLRELSYLIEENRYADNLLLTKVFNKGKFCCELSNSNSFLVYVLDSKNRRYFEEYGVYGNNNTSKQVINALHAIFHKKSRLL